MPNDQLNLNIVEQTIQIRMEPSPGAIPQAGAAGRVAVFLSANQIKGFSTFTYDNNNDILSVGQIVVLGDPTGNLQVATKQYVDNSSSSITTDGQGLEVSLGILSLELDGSTLTKSASGLRVNADLTIDSITIESIISPGDLSVIAPGEIGLTATGDIGFSSVSGTVNFSSAVNMSQDLTVSGAINLTNETASRLLFLDSSKDVVTNSNWTWNGSTSITGHTLALNTLSASQTSTLTRVDVGGATESYELGATPYTVRLRVNQAGSAKSFTIQLPADEPSAGQVLSISAYEGALGTGVMQTEWTTVSSGSGTVNSGTQYQVVYYAANGTAVSGLSNLVTDAGGALSHAASVRNASNPTFYFRVVTPADTALTASTESIGVQFGGNTSAATVTRQYATGALALHRENLFVGNTIGFVGASTLTEAVNVQINRLVQGANATFTNNYNLSLPTDGIGTTSTPALLLINHSAAGNGAQQYSGAIEWWGYGFRTTDSSSKPVQWRAEALAVQGTSNPTGTLNFSSNISSAGWTNRFQITSSGNLILPNTNGTLSIQITQGSTGLAIETATTRPGIGSTTAHTFSIFANNTYRFGIVSGGSMFLGRDFTPAYDFHFDKGNSTAVTIGLTTGTGSGITSSDGFTIGLTTSSVAEIRQKEAQVLDFYNQTTKTLTLTADNALQLPELSANPAAPTQDVALNWYMKADKLVIQFNNGGTTRYFTLDLTQSIATPIWAQSTSAP